MIKSKKTKKQNPQLKFYQKLALNQFLLKSFGADTFKDLAASLKNPDLEIIDDEGVTGFHKQLTLQFSSTSTISEIKLAEYDLNIVSHLRKINEKRNDEIRLKYFQYLTLLFVEYYLDQYFNHKNSFLIALNQYLQDFNEEYPSDAITEYEEKDLNKIALWNATGSGKTLLMHINYHQYLHYAQGKLTNGSSFILLTPKADLSSQHLTEFSCSSINAKIYDKSANRFLTKQDSIIILENTKLDTKEGEKKIAVSRFGNQNIVFVDEGHRGTSGTAWYDYRNQLCEEGFSFEYSATFGQAVKAAGKNTLLQEYAKCILFDYSYKYFYGDGYGKDYCIMNLENNDDNDCRNIYLSAALLTYYQQKKFYLTEKLSIKEFNLENPLFVFVGSSVNAIRKEKGKDVSDVVDILSFFKNFATKPNIFAVYIERILNGTTGILDTHHNRDVFRYSFPYLASTSLEGQAVYEEILKTVFNCSQSGATLHIENLKGVDGEIQVRLGENVPFALINVGDTANLLKLCDANGFHTNTIDFNESLFRSINHADSSINLLVGSKKFTEGWNSWRVSTMGLMNIGRSEGSEIIQLFGRGVRLKGYGMSLKRSNFVAKDIVGLDVPKHLGVLETLNIFGVRADYMKIFKEMLEEEGVPSDKDMPMVLTMPVIKNKQYKQSNILTLKVKDNLDYKKHGAKPCLEYIDGIKVELDCYAKVQFETSTKSSNIAVTKNENGLKQEHLALLDYDFIYFELQRYKREKARYNVNLDIQKIKELIHNHRWYTLYIPNDELEITSFSDFKKIEKIVISLLFKYFDRFYYTQKNSWEKPLLELVPMGDNDVNFLKDDEYTITISNSDDNKWAKQFIETIASEITTAKNKKRIPNFVKTKNDMEVAAFSALMYSPFLYVATKNKEIVVAPVALNESENKFIQDLKKYIEANETYFSDKEIYIIRNKSKKGIGFFEGNGFYPDFIMWVVHKGKQYMSFIDPHGLRNSSFTDPKVELYAQIKTIEASLNNKVILNSFILSPTKFVNLVDKTHSEDDWNNKNVFFMEDGSYVKNIMENIL